MYALKPVISLPEKISLPTVMYELSRIQGGACSSGSGNSSATKLQEGIVVDIASQMTLPEYNLLEARQVRILDQISELKQQVECLCIAVRVSTDVKDPTKILQNLDLNIQANQPPVHAEIIVLANPNSPPYFILALQRLWKDIKFHVKIHRHSTSTDESTKNFEEKILSSVPKNFSHIIDVTLIWKDVSDIQLLTKVYDYPLEGESNILRYLTRLIENYNYESSKSSSTVCIFDNILDLCLRLSYDGAKNLNGVATRIASYLDKKMWLLDDFNASIVDVAVWSVVKRLAKNKVPHLLKNWYDLCEETFLAV